jgi:hypothetical protein
MPVASRIICTPYRSTLSEDPPSSKLVEFVSFHLTTAQVTMTPIKPPFDDVLNSYMNHVVQKFYPEPAEFEQANQKRDSFVHFEPPVRKHERIQNLRADGGIESTSGQSSHFL